MTYLLLCRTGDDAGLPHRISGTRCVIGRAQECELSLLDTQLSRQHAIVFDDADGLRVQDLGSRNGTAVNGVRLEDNATAPLAHEDVLRLSETLELVLVDLDRIPVTRVLAGVLVAAEGTRVPLRPA
jgi:pSer/pThr/pTyr-binding forkhead associated (FHA) protein